MGLLRERERGEIQMGRCGAYLQVLERSGVALGEDAVELDGLPHQHLYQRRDLNFRDLVSLGDRFLYGGDLAATHYVRLASFLSNLQHRREPFETVGIINNAFQRGGGPFMGQRKKMLLLLNPSGPHFTFHQSEGDKKDRLHRPTSKIGNRIGRVRTTR